jgi:hypothetical protein
LRQLSNVTMLLSTVLSQWTLLKAQGWT